MFIKAYHSALCRALSCAFSATYEQAGPSHVTLCSCIVVESALGISDDFYRRLCM